MSADDKKDEPSKSRSSVQRTLSSESKSSSIISGSSHGKENTDKPGSRRRPVQRTSSDNRRRRSSSRKRTVRRHKSNDEIELMGGTLRESAMAAKTTLPRDSLSIRKVHRKHSGGDSRTHKSSSKTPPRRTPSMGGKPSKSKSLDSTSMLSARVTISLSLLKDFVKESDGYCCPCEVS